MQQQELCRGHFCLTINDAFTPPNSTILRLSVIIWHIVSFAGEAEIATLFYNVKNVIPHQTTLNKLGHCQPTATIVTDDEASHGLMMKSVVPKALKSMDILFNWLTQFEFAWQKGANNLAEYHTKHHPARHHQAIRKTYLLDLITPQ